MLFWLAIVDLTHPLKNNPSSIGMIGCFILLYRSSSVYYVLALVRQTRVISYPRCNMEGVAFNSNS